MSEWTNWLVIICGVLVAVIFWNAAKTINFEFKYPLFVAVMAYCIVTAAITPCLYGMGNIEARRIKGVIFTMYLLLLMLTICYVTGWVRKQFDGKVQKQLEYSCNSRIAIMACMAFLAAGYILTAAPEPDTFTTSEAIVELVSGEAKAYGDAMKERAAKYRSGEKNIVVQELPSRPRLLYVSDIKEDPMDWENSGICRFFELESVRLEKRQ